MKKLIDVILSKNCLLMEDAQKTVKEIVLQEADNAKCVKMASGYSIKSGRQSLGRGTTKDTAWERAALQVLNM